LSLNKSGISDSSGQCVGIIHVKELKVCEDKSGLQ